MAPLLKSIKGKVTGIIGSISGAASVLGSWQVCHNICIGIIALLGVLGIAVSGMPLFFLTQVAIPFWIGAVVLLGVTLVLYVQKRCVSEKLILFNSGLIVAGVPFPAVQDYSLFFWIVGGLLAAAGAALFVRDKWQKGKK